LSPVKQRLKPNLSMRPTTAHHLSTQFGRTYAPSGSSASHYNDGVSVDYVSEIAKELDA
jgi:hypothetical protein